ncbi:MAG: hypothetical protein KGR18_10035 [Acidobacteria bacterium]|nr:hypothetical protein [Acidobacteriota bacterium]
MTIVDHRWEPSPDREVRAIDPDLVGRIRWIHLDNTAAGQVAPGVRETRYNGQRVPYLGEVSWGGATFHVTDDASLHGIAGLPVNQQGSVSRMAMCVKGVPAAGSGVLVPVAQLPDVIDLLIGLLAPSKEAEHGVMQWSLAQARVGDETRVGVWFIGSLPVVTADGTVESTSEELFRRVAETVDVECSFGIQQRYRDESLFEACGIWGPDGSFVTELSGRIVLERPDGLESLRELSADRQRRAGASVP